MSKSRLAVLDGSTVRWAAGTSDGEVLVTETERERNKWSRFIKADVGATAVACLVDLSTAVACLVDLSDTVNYPHESTARIDISALSIQIDRASNSTGSVRVGVVTRVDATNGDVSFFKSIFFSNAADTYIHHSENYAPSQMKLGVSGGVLTRGVTNDKLLNTTLVQSDVAIESYQGAGTVTPAAGDIVIYFEYTAGTAYDASVRIFYHGETTV